MPIAAGLKDRLRRDATAITRDVSVRAAGGFLVGTVAASLWPKTAAVIGLGYLAFAVLRRALGERKVRKLSSWEQALLRPDNHAMKRVRASNQALLVAGQVTELRHHSTVNSRRELARVGWVPTEVGLIVTQRSFNASAILALAGGMREFDHPNGRKFSLTDHSLAGTEDDLVLHVEETDYFTIMSVKKLLQDTPAVRAEFGALEPSKNRVPNSLCLHFVLRFAEGSVLLLHNDPRKAYDGTSWSISAEEQMNVADTRSLHPIDSLFRRAICEEVFGLREEDTPLEERWERIARHSQYYRIWSLFLEDPYCNFSLFGVAQLALTPALFLEEYNRFIAQGYAKDPEGTFHIASHRDQESLLYHDQATVKELFGGAAVAVHTDELHRTSRYRMFRLLRSLAKGPLHPPS